MATSSIEMGLVSYTVPNVVPVPDAFLRDIFPDREAFVSDAVATNSLAPNTNSDDNDSSSSDDSNNERLGQETHGKSSALTIDLDFLQKLLKKYSSF